MYSIVILCLLLKLSILSIILIIRYNQIVFPNLFPINISIVYSFSFSNSFSIHYHYKIHFHFPFTSHLFSIVFPIISSHCLSIFHFKLTTEMSTVVLIYIHLACLPSVCYIIYLTLLKNNFCYRNNFS